MKFETEVKPTPKQLAEAFWNMYDDEQVEFFAELFNAAGMGESYYNFELQAFHIHDKIRSTENEEAKEALMSLAAPFFYHTLNDTY
jgi:hypothetical protein